MIVFHWSCTYMCYSNDNTAVVTCCITTFSNPEHMFKTLRFLKISEFNPSSFLEQNRVYISMIFCPLIYFIPNNMNPFKKCDSLTCFKIMKLKKALKYELKIRYFFTRSLIMMNHLVSLYWKETRRKSEYFNEL